MFHPPPVFRAKLLAMKHPSLSFTDNWKLPLWQTWQFCQLCLSLRLGSTLPSPMAKMAAAHPSVMIATIASSTPLCGIRPPIAGFFAENSRGFCSKPYCRRQCQNFHTPPGSGARSSTKPAARSPAQKAAGMLVRSISSVSRNCAAVSAPTSSVVIAGCAPTN